MLSISYTIEGIAPYSQSKKNIPAKGENEGPDDYEERIWRFKAHVVSDADDTIVIPGHGIHQMLVLGAQKGRLKPKAAKSTREGLMKRLETGIAIQGDAITSMKLSEARCVAINAHVNGKRGSGSRVTRKFPEWSPPWTALFEVLLLDDSLAEQDITAALKIGGLVAGLGRFRPENIGMNGRFLVGKISTSELGISDLKAA